MPELLDAPAEILVVVAHLPLLHGDEPDRRTRVPLAEMAGHQAEFLCAEDGGTVRLLHSSVALGNRGCHGPPERSET